MRVIAAALAATGLCLTALFATPGPASARCSNSTLSAIANKIFAAHAQVKTAPALAKRELRNRMDDLHSCYGTARWAQDRWLILALREHAALEIAAAVANQGKFSESRSLVRAVRHRLANFSVQVDGDETFLRGIALLREEADAVDGRVRNGQRVNSRKFAGNHPRRSTPKPAPTEVACASPNVAATVTHPVMPDAPPVSAEQGIQGTVRIVVSLDADSHVVGARVQSSPSTILNQAALAAARQSTYQTEIRDCRPVASDFIYTVEFIGQ